MKIIDLHCDVLSKLSRTEPPIEFSSSIQLQASKDKLKVGQVAIQDFAIFIGENIPQAEKFNEAMRQVELFYTNVLQPNPDIIHITDWKQIYTLKEGQIGAILSLEGCDAIGEDLLKLEVLLNAGVKLVGLTWNFENSVAYGAEEDPNQGLKPFGKEVIQLLNARDIIIDVSHLNEKSFWDVLPLAKHLIASHSNAKALCDHTRNLSDEQAIALVKQGGHIHVVYYPPFIKKDTDYVTIDDLVRHVKYLAELVGIEHIGLGSDFDGIDRTVIGLENASQSQNLILSLLQQFSEDEVKMIANENFLRYIQKQGI